jgi:hypothetical protein
MGRGFLHKEQEFLTQRRKGEKGQRIFISFYFFATLRQKIFWLVQVRLRQKHLVHIIQPAVLWGDYEGGWL